MNVWDGMTTLMNLCNKDFMITAYSMGVCGWSIHGARIMGTVGLLAAPRLIPSSVVAKCTKHKSTLKTLQIQSNP